MTADRRALWTLRILGSLALVAAGLALAWLSVGILERDRGAEADPLLFVWGAYGVTAWIFARIAWRPLR